MRFVLVFHKVWSTGCCVAFVVGVEIFFNVKIKKKKKGNKKYHGIRD